jgi:hypothetical protein
MNFNKIDAIDSVSITSHRRGLRDFAKRKKAGPIGKENSLHKLPEN